jgi:hypothetical protein
MYLTLILDSSFHFADLTKEGFASVELMFAAVAVMSTDFKRFDQ